MPSWTCSMAFDRSQGAIVCRRDGRWRLAPLNDASQSCWLDSDDLAIFIGEHHLRSANVVVAVHAEITYLVSLPVNADSSFDSDAAITFAIEAELPIDAESMVVAHQRFNEKLICNVAEVQPIWECVETLESLGLRVQHIVVESFLWMQFQSLSRAIADGVVVCSPVNETMVEVCQFENGTPVAWSRCHDDASEIEREITMMTDASFAAMVNEPIRLTMESESDWQSDVNEASERLLSGKMTPWFELRRGRLAAHDPLRPIRSSVFQFAVALMAMLVIIVASLSWKTMQLTSIRENAVASMEESFREAFPDQRLPTAIVKRIRSEHKKAIGQRSVSSTVRRPVDAFPVLSNIIAALPEDLSFQVRSIRIQDGEFQLDIDLESLDATAQITRHLDEAGFETLPPSTTRVANGKIQTRLRGEFDSSRVVSGGAR